MIKYIFRNIANKLQSRHCQVNRFVTTNDNSYKLLFFFALITEGEDKDKYRYNWIGVTQSNLKTKSIQDRLIKEEYQTLKSVDADIIGYPT